MHPIYEEFEKLIETEDKAKTVEFIIEKLDKNELDIVSLYIEILDPILNRFSCDVEDEKLCIWKEHVRTAIVKTIIGISYSYLLKERKKRGISESKGKVLVTCPSDEHHDVGARIIADIFTLNGFDTIFTGANTPRSEILDALNYIQPEILAISVTNYYNIIETCKIVESIKTSTNYKGKILLGGTAFLSNPKVCEQIGVDFYVANFKELINLIEEEIAK
jgi:methanogenic corrinoid protein MtbC1